MDIDALRAQHNELAELAHQLLAVIAREQPQKVAALRWRLARLLIAHLSVEDRYLYPAMIAQAGPAMPVAKRFRGEMGGLATEFTAYLRRWTDQDIARQWAIFREDTQRLLNALIDRIRRENEELYPRAPVGWRGIGAAVANAA